MGFTVTGIINRKDFGLQWNFVLEGGGVMVGDKVNITIHAEVVAQ
jgi:polyisoprenoid-binding protein YceI